MANLKEMYEKRAALHAQMKELTKDANFSKEEFDKMEKDYQSYTDQIQATEKIEAREAEQIRSYNENLSTRKEVDNRQAVNSAWRNLILRGHNGLTTEEKELIFNNSDPNFRAAQQSTTAGAGGYTIPTGFSNEIAVAEKYYSVVANIARVVRTSTGNDLAWPKVNDTAVSAYLLAEAGNHETSSTALTFTSSTLKAFQYTSGMIRVSAELLQDSFFDMGMFLSDIFAERFGRGLNALYTTGGGTTTIQGVVTGATSSGISGVAATAVTRDNILDLIHSVDPAYRMKPNFAIMMNDSTLAAIRKLDYGTADARPLYQESAMDGAPAKIEGVPVIINPAMASIGASAKSILVGDFSNYIIREVAGDTFKVLYERFADTNELAFVMIRRRDGQVIDAGMHPLKYMAHAAS